MQILWSHVITVCEELKFRSAFPENHLRSCRSLFCIIMLPNEKQQLFGDQDKHEWDFRSDEQVSVHKAIALLHSFTFIHLAYAYKATYNWKTCVIVQMLSEPLLWCIIFGAWQLLSLWTAIVWKQSLHGEKNPSFKNGILFGMSASFKLKHYIRLCEFTIIFCWQISLLLFGSLLVHSCC